MTEEQLSKLNPSESSSELAAKIVVEAFESRFPDLLKDESRRLLFSFIDNSFFHFMDGVKGENSRHKAAIYSLARRPVPFCSECADIREFCRDILGWNE
jgi:hypothetical protein